MAAFEDLSGTSTPSTDNPYQGLITACQDDPAEIQSRYHTHRTKRNEQMRAKLLAHDFPGVQIDEILEKIENPSLEPGFEDWRNCLVFWGRPPARVKSLIAEIQRRLLAVAPNLWIMPPSSLHITAMEITHSLTAEEIDSLVEKLQPSIPDIADYTFNHRACLVKPLLSFDAQALALSFLPAAGERRNAMEEDAYTYHHLRRDLFDMIQATGVKISSRYVIPSAHLTIGRFITKADFSTPDGDVSHGKVAELIKAIDEINDWLQKDYWSEDGATKESGEWFVGEEKGLEAKKGTLWYGGGQRLHLGKGF